MINTRIRNAQMLAAFIIAVVAIVGLIIVAVDAEERDAQRDHDMRRECLGAGGDIVHLDTLDERWDCVHRRVP